MRWLLSWRADPQARVLADRHYNRQKVGARQFVPPGGCLVLRTHAADAFWITSTPIAEYVRHAWAGAWVCSAFRNEGRADDFGYLSSNLIRDALAASRAELGGPPPLGIVTFVDRAKVRGKQDFGYCYQRAGFAADGWTDAGLLALRLGGSLFPPAEAAIRPQGTLALVFGPELAGRKSSKPMLNDVDSE